MVHTNIPKLLLFFKERQIWLGNRPNSAGKSKTLTKGANLSFNPTKLRQNKNQESRLLVDLSEEVNLKYSSDRYFQSYCGNSSKSVLPPRDLAYKL